jgi:mevalonate kinase
MILGEHAVLQGKRALVCAINRRIRVVLREVSRTGPGDAVVEIESALGHYCEPVSELPVHSGFRFVLEAIRSVRARIPGSFVLRIESDFSSTIGFGSSAAVTVAVHAALHRWIYGAELAPESLFEAALKTVHAVQGRGSGADVAASVLGGMVQFSTAPTFRVVPVAVPLTAVFCGYKVPTAEVIQRVEGLRRQDPVTYERLYEEMDRSAVLATEALERGDLAAFGALINRNQTLMDQLGVNTAELAQIVEALQHDSGLYGAKISGSGMGDCAVGIGRALDYSLAFDRYDLEVSPNGVKVDGGE